MNLGHLVTRSLRQHALSSTVTAAGVALAGGLLLATWLVHDRAREAFTGMTGGVDAVLGARGSQLQLVLNSVFHLDESTGNIERADFDDLRRHPGIDAAVPIAVGDNYRGYRVVGTHPDFFTRLNPGPGQSHRVRPPGRVFDPDLREAVVGSFAARQLRLKRGDTFRPYHGLRFDEAHPHEEEYLVVGILEPSNTPADRVIWIPLEGLQTMSGHDPTAATHLSAVLLKFKANSPLLGQQLARRYNLEDHRLTLAWPVARTVAQLFDRIVWADRLLRWIAYLVALVAAGSILASIYNSMQERRREIAILRALGARRATVFGAIVMEAAAIAGIGMAAAFGVGAIILAWVGAVLREETGVVLDLTRFHPVWVIAPIGMISLGALAGLIPAWKAYRTDVAENLVPHS